MNTAGPDRGNLEGAGHGRRVPRSWTRRHFVQAATTSTALAAGAAAFATPSAVAAPQNSDFADPVYDRPVIDSTQDLTSPVPHRKVTGHFEGTDKKFTFCFPPKQQWRGRFFQQVYPLQSEIITDEVLSATLASGAYAVQTKAGVGYRVDAAAAVYSRTVAAAYYASAQQIYGYIWGGSGGSYQTIGAIENTTGVWDGAVPFVPGTPAALPNSFTVRALARLVLLKKAPRIAEAVRPGSSWDPYDGLNKVERAVLLEATRMGVPLQAWENYSYVLGLDDPQLLMGIANQARKLDPTYMDDFWTQPGYLGVERSALGDIIRDARYDHSAVITKVNTNASSVSTSLLLDTAPADPNTANYDFTLYSADGKTKIGALTGTLDTATKVFTLGTGNPQPVLDALVAGARVRVDNRWFIALHAYHRYAIPTRPGFYAYDLFRGPDGKPLYPQRPVNLPEIFSSATSGGGTFTGKINGKMIVVANLIDTDAFPWPADWYRTLVMQSMGDDFDDNYRVWFNDHADHVANDTSGPTAARLVPYSGILVQALRDLSAWVEEGVHPARSTSYKVTPDSQIVVPRDAATRRGIQPVVELSADGGDHLEVRVGERITFRAKIAVPSDAGRIVAAEWDFNGVGSFESQPCGPARRALEVRATHAYNAPGTYYPGLRATAQRQGDGTTPFGRIQNLGRMRVVVR